MKKGSVLKKMLLLTLALPLLASCTGSKPLKLEGGVTEQVVEIVVWDKPFAGSADKPYYDLMFQEFERLYPHIRVIHMEAAYQKEREQFMTAVAGGEQPDLYNAAFPDMETYIDQGIPADITELWEAYPDRIHYSPIAMDTASQRGRVYGIPNLMYVTALAYNKRIFQEQQLQPEEVLQDWDTFAKAARDLKDASKDRYGYAILGTEWADWFYEYYVWQAGGDLTRRHADGSVELTFNSEAAVRALEYYQDLRFQYDAIQPDVLQSLDDSKKDFYFGRAATMIVASNWFGEMRESGVHLEDIGIAMFPAGPAGVSLSQVGGGIWIFNPKASKEKQQAAFTYATFMTSKYAHEEMLRFQQEQGKLPNLLSYRDDVNPAIYAEGMPGELVRSIQQAAEQSRLEYFLKSRLSPYVSKAVQEALLREEADPYELLTRAQEQAEKEVVQQYNEDIR
ncbi:extracellular solute-binding protein [Paenibacillus sp. F411]|uniref:extracellular solute-binding protein n=1 Tax=Paenibacillus sp. F411 TaxID=2820239 RepID=UPI001AAF6644|nr:extracellular solute-binding protein [Paenibacillus sp. F411]MBO2942380.1 extracellular solute-binding protein [Paenibacillus sp. F411]